MKLDQNYGDTSIRTYTGESFDIVNPNPETINIEDIAHGLAYTPRFSGHLEGFYTVAQHCVLALELVPDSLKFTMLMHDASESYLPDMPKPFKSVMPCFVALEDNLMQVIAKKYAFMYPLPPEIKAADYAMLSEEWNTLIMKLPREVLSQDIEYWAPEKAKEEFNRAFFNWSLYRE